MASWTRATVIDALRRFSVNGEAPSSNRWLTDRPDGAPTVRTVQHVFGSWSAAVAAAGLAPYRRRRADFWSRMTKPEEGCWEWRAGKDGREYGLYHLVPGHKIKAHRYAWELTYGPIPDGLYVCHHCDNRICCRPDHLFLGTAKDNAEDASRKGRLKPVCGERNHWTKFTDTEIQRALRLHARGLSHVEVAAQTGISPSYICRLAQGSRR